MLKYSYPGPHDLPTHEIAVRFLYPNGRSWIGTFECARDRRLNIMPWDEAESVVVVTPNALYIIDSSHPEISVGFTAVAPAKIGNAIFNESRAMLFVAESLRIRAYGLDRKLLWISELPEGHDPVIQRCVNGVLSVDIENDDERRKSIQIRAKDGTIVRWPRFSCVGFNQILRRKSA
jgi:hypothetical protein